MSHAFESLQAKPVIWYSVKNLKKGAPGCLRMITIDAPGKLRKNWSKDIGSVSLINRATGMFRLVNDLPFHHQDTLAAKCRESECIELPTLTKADVSDGILTLDLRRRRKV